MTKRICWKKGMRLSDEILRASDNSTAELIGNALVLAAAGRFGLFPSTTPFELSLNISKGIVDVEQLTCLAVTKGGHLIDAHYDTKFTNSFDTRVQIPEGNGEKELILTINALPEQWQDSNDGYEEPMYSFSLIVPNSPIPLNALPIARIVDEYGWRMDDLDFVPPCLYVTSHQKYLNLLKQFSDVLSAIDAKARNLVHSNGRDAIRIFWPVVQQLMIETSKECDMMTPMGLLSNVQKCVSAFTCACELDEYLNLADAETFRNYVYAPYNYKDSYLRIKEGLELCFSINEKVGKISEVKQTVDKRPSPTISNEHLVKKCTSTRTTIPINCTLADASVYYTIDGSDPTPSSQKAQKGRNGLTISFKNGYHGSSPEPDKKIIVKLKAIAGNTETETGIYELLLKKDPRTFIEI